MHFKFQCADAVRDAFDNVIAQAVREVIHRINFPFRAGVMMPGVADAIKNRVAQPDVGRCHVNLRAERARAVGKFAVAHAAEQVEIFFRRAIAERRIFSRTIRRAAIKFHVGGRKIADEGFATFDQLLGVIGKSARSNRSRKMVRTSCLNFCVQSPTFRKSLVEKNRALPSPLMVSRAFCLLA